MRRSAHTGAPVPASQVASQAGDDHMVHSDVWEGPCRFNVVSVAKGCFKAEGLRLTDLKYVLK